ncbi:unnamed protein product [Scytosiphon promiscuus]
MRVSKQKGAVKSQSTTEEMAGSRMPASNDISGSLRERITVFLDDLRNFNEQPLLENYVDSTFMSSTYFTTEEIERLQAISIGGEALKDKLDDLVRKRAEKDGEICSSHDLRPLYERYFGFGEDDMRNFKVAKARVSWRNWRESLTSLESTGMPTSDAREALEKKIQKAREKNRNKEVERLSLLLDNTQSRRLSYRFMRGLCRYAEPTACKKPGAIAWQDLDNEDAEIIVEPRKDGRDGGYTKLRALPQTRTLLPWPR